MGDLTEILWEMERGLDQVQFMLKVLTGFLGVIVAAMLIFGVIVFFKLRHAQRTTLAALQSEVRLNLGIAEEVLQTSTEFDSGAPDPLGKQLHEMIPMSEIAWLASIGGGGLAHLDKQTIDPLTQTYAKVHRVNAYAAKVEEREYNPEYAVKYNTYLKAAQTDLTKALKLLERQS